MILLENLVNNKKMNMVMVFMIEDNIFSVYFFVMTNDALINGIQNNIIRWHHHPNEDFKQGTQPPVRIFRVHIHPEKME